MLALGDGTLMPDETDRELERALLEGEGVGKPWGEKLTLWGIDVSGTCAKVAGFNIGWPGGYSLWRGTKTGGKTEIEKFPHFKTNKIAWKSDI